MLRSLTVIILTLAITTACTKQGPPEDFLSDVKFDISTHLLEHKNISSIATDKDGNVWIASGKELYYTNGIKEKVYTVDFPILDISVAPDKSVWIGTNGGGLGHLTGNEFKWYTVANAGLPRDYVRHVKTDPDGNVWFSSCAFRLGGLGLYDGIKVKFFTPENSALNQNVIDNIEIGGDGSVYIASSGTVGKSNIYKINGKTWKCLGNEEGTFYWINSFTVDPEDNIYAVEDFSLSSAWHDSNLLHKYNEDKWSKIDTKGMGPIRFFTRLKADKNGLVWIAGIEGNNFNLNVYDGYSWLTSPDGLFPEDFITCIEVDKDNNILVGTYNNGVFILNQ